MNVTIVIPTIGRESLQRLLATLAAARGPRAAEILIVDDRPAPTALDVDARALGCPVRVFRSGGRGPAAARNVGWRAARSAWIAFLDDDVEVERHWYEHLASDLDVAEDVGASSAHISVPLPHDRRPTDWERNVAGLAQAKWITADMAYRRRALEDVGGFDERFKRAYREDADLAIRVQRVGYTIAQGGRRSVHPVRAARGTISVALQRGNADDVLMRALHGPQWRRLARAPRGRMRAHAVTVGCAVVALVAAADGKKRVAAVAAAAWLAATAEFAIRRIAPGPRDAREVTMMAATSAAIPFAAVFHSVRGFVTLPRLLKVAA